MINVAQPYLPPYKDYEKYLKGIWERKWLTNHGPLVLELEEKLKKYLGVKHLFYVNNGTIALQIAIKALNLKGNIITTPFSYVATTNSILWENCKPVFADIKNTDFNIDPEKIIPLIDSNTSAIVATHVYGNPCDVEAIEKIAQENNLKVIYDGAHAFDTKLNGKQVLSFGDIATCSFHATKLFHTVEGGAIITNDDTLAQKILLYRQFGHMGDEYFTIGINGKNSEFHAAMGLCVLPMMNSFIDNRKATSELYDFLLTGLPIQTPKAIAGTGYNYSYYPIIFDSEERLLLIKSLLQQNQINTRRYFYPSLNNLPQYKGEVCPVSESVSVRALALPMYYDLEKEIVSKICDLIKTCF
jgi:dTDP-4-amino-4,6-dideoxygalactose transaminase